MKALSSLKPEDRVVLDTMFWIYLFEDAPRYGVRCQAILDLIGAGRFKAVVTPVTAAELLVKPIKQNRADIADHYRRALTNLKNVELQAMTFQVGCLAGALRAKYDLPLPDMLQAACAIGAQAPRLLTNDKALRRVAELQVILLDDLL